MESGASAIGQPKARQRNRPFARFLLPLSPNSVNRLLDKYPLDMDLTPRVYDGDIGAG